MKDFRLTTDYPLDKIVFFNQQDNLSNADGVGGHSATVPHGLPFTPLVFGVWATSGAFDDPRHFALLVDSAFGFVQCYADATNIYIDSCASASGSPVNCWARVYAFEPAGSVGEVPPTNAQATPLVFSTDYSYCKLFSAQTFDTSSGSIATITHNLGYRPQVMVWGEIGGVIEQYYGGAVLDATWGEGIEVTATAIIMRYSPFAGRKLHVRVYLDEA